MTKKFRVNTDLPLEKKNDVQSELFGNQAEKENLNTQKADKSFTIPLNDYELEMLRLYAKQKDRSMRSVSRRLIREILELKLK